MPVPMGVRAVHGAVGLVCGAPPSLLGWGEPPFPCAVGMNPSPGAGWAGMVPGLQGGGCARPQTSLAAALPTLPQRNCNGKKNNCWFSPAAPTLATLSLPSPAVPDEPLPLPRGDLKGRLKAGVEETQHISPSSTTL